MGISRGFLLFCTLPFLLHTAYWDEARAQEKIKISYSSADTTNALYFVAQEQNFYKRHGLEVELVFVPSTITSVSSLLSGDVKFTNATGGAIASAVIGGANLAIIACHINTLPYELVVHESIKSAENLKGKSIGISRVGSASDMAAHFLVRGLGLEPVKDVPITDVGDAAKMAAAVRTGKIAGFPSPPGIINLAKDMPYRILISAANFQKRFDFPYACVNTTRTFLAGQRDTVKRVAMALIEATQFFKTRREESKKIIAKYSKQNNEAYLESSYSAVAKLYERVPLVTRPGLELQIKEALAGKPGARLRFEDLVDENVVRELEKNGFIDRVYGQ
ncbi:MAG: ABC transporter substrate-binding protein [Candidatus Binatota bacterium]